VGAGRHLWLDGHVFTLGASASSGSGFAVAEVLAAGGTGAPSEPRSEVRAAVGISDEDGMLQWVELAPEDEAGARDPATRDQMLALLQRLGCSQRALVAGDLRAFPGGSLDSAGQPAVPAGTAPAQVRLVRERAPGARSIFEGVQVVPQSVWYTLQAQRVKWRPTLAPPDKQKPAAAASGSATAPDSSSAPSAPPTAAPPP
jgi:hypothetical protein